ncbi:type IV secretion system DNA-binding domain-containing protein [Ulvibacterium sp.]|uniref:type IV secretory system conjugative DNA transfer family protein n=1 Tax=Ulvibacterium sp. TaxID=2665914 RepID=UPI0026267691|nr:type IV secretion system DNA-binding domain-containing protein [Ulvibacterium sp.]
METLAWKIVLFLISSLVVYSIVRFFRFGFFLNLLWLFLALVIQWYIGMEMRNLLRVLLIGFLPLFLLNIGCYVFIGIEEENTSIDPKYRVRFKVRKGNLVLENIRRGISIIGSAGSGKTESVVHGLLQHFKRHNFCGVIHDYKDFEITEMAYPIFGGGKTPFYVISFDPIYFKVNPIAPRYLPDEESVHEVSRVLVENLLELKESGSSGNSHFFNTAAEGLIGGMMWRLKTDYKNYCTLPHLIALYQYLTTKELVAFLGADITSKAMADAFINGAGSDRQTAAVKSTLSNAFKKISTQRIFMALSDDKVPLNINSGKNNSVICVVNNPKYETSLSPIIATIIHTITKQMSVRNGSSSFLLMEEAPTIRLLNMHRVPATLRSYDIATVYVMQDKIQNDMMYGEKGSRAILSNLSYQFFGKTNDPDTAKYYERFFEIVKKETRSVSKGFNLNFDTRVTKGEKEVSKNRADTFYGLRQGEFVVFADGKDRKVQFKTPRIVRQLPPLEPNSQEVFQKNFERIHGEVREIFNE